MTWGSADHNKEKIIGMRYRPVGLKLRTMLLPLDRKNTDNFLKEIIVRIIVICTITFYVLCSNTATHRFQTKDPAYSARSG